MRKLFLLIALVFLGGKIFAESDKGILAERTIKSDGDTRCAFNIMAGSQTAVSPYDFCGGTDTRSNRTTLIINPSSIYVLYIATFITTSPSDSSFFVNPSSSSWNTSNHQKFWCYYEAGASSGPIRGNIEAQ